MVSEFTVDELGDDSEDERRLEKADLSAEKKAAKCKKCVDPTSVKQTTRFVPAVASGMAGPSGY